MLIVDNSELKEPLETTIECPTCFQRHLVEYGNKILEDGTAVPSKLLAFYRCGDKIFLAGINGRVIRKTNQTIQ